MARLPPDHRKAAVRRSRSACFSVVPRGITSSSSEAGVGKYTVMVTGLGRWFSIMRHCVARASAANEKLLGTATKLAKRFASAWAPAAKPTDCVIVAGHLGHCRHSSRPPSVARRQTKTALAHVSALWCWQFFGVDMFLRFQREREWLGISGPSGLGVFPFDLRG